MFKKKRNDIEVKNYRLIFEGMKKVNTIDGGFCETYESYPYQSRKSKYSSMDEMYSEVIC
jgi:hypothetical protein